MKQLHFLYHFLSSRTGFIRILFITGLITNPYFLRAVAQERPAYDTSYYINYRDAFIGRIFLSEKYTYININDKKSGRLLKYHPNTRRVFGVGFTYQPLTLNIAFGTGFLNNDKQKGETKSIDAKAHIYSNKWVVDLYAQHYKSFYTFSAEADTVPIQPYYLRPDMKIFLGGFAAYRVLNNRRFSYRPAFIQDTWQKKSAGSLMVGLASFYTRISASNPFSSVDQNDLSGNIKSVSIIQLGPGAGYAYHLVLPLNLFIMGSINGNMNLTLITESNGIDGISRLKINPSILYRGAVGYSNGNWNLNLSVFNQQLPGKGARTGNKYVISTGNFRLTLAKRFQLGQRGKQLLKPLSDLNVSPSR